MEEVERSCREVVLDLPRRLEVHLLLHSKVETGFGFWGGCALLINSNLKTSLKGSGAFRPVRSSFEKPYDPRKRHGDGDWVGENGEV